MWPRAILGATVSVRGFGDLEAVIMDHLWSRSEPVTVRDIHTELSRHRQIAYTTVLTVMDNLHRKGWLRRELVGRAHRYRPVSSREQYGAQVMREALDGSGDRAQALMHFVGRMTPDEAAALRHALRAFDRGLTEK
jgi:predicted transcriptional regulator